MMRRARAAILRLISENETLLRAAVKAAAALLLPALIARLLPVPEVLGSLPALLCAALCGAVFPDFMLMIVCAVYAVAGLAMHSPAAGICGGVLIGLLLLIFLCFVPRRGLTAALFAVGMCLHFPYAVLAPAVLLGGGSAAAACLLTGAGWYGAAALMETEASAGFSVEESLADVPETLVKLFTNRQILIGLIILLAAALVIWLISLLPAGNALFFAAVFGAVCYAALGIMELQLKEQGTFAVLADTAAGLLTGLAAAWLTARPDYKRAYTLRFEDDEYYYTVRAVPKIGEASADRTASPMSGQGEDNEEAEE